MEDIKLLEKIITKDTLNRLDVYLFVELGYKLKKEVLIPEESEFIINMFMSGRINIRTSALEILKNNFPNAKILYKQNKPIKVYE